MNSHSFAQSVELMVNVVSRTLSLLSQWVSSLFVRAYQGRMSITHCLFFILVANAVYFAFWEWFVGVFNLPHYFRYDYLFLPATFFTMVCIWQCSSTIQATFARLVVRLLLFVLGINYLTYASIIFGIINIQPPQALITDKSVNASSFN